MNIVINAYASQHYFLIIFRSFVAIDPLSLCLFKGLGPNFFSLLLVLLENKVIEE